MDGFAVGRCAEGEVELDCCHFDDSGSDFLVFFSPWVLSGY
jgi:hypothetical protein